MGTYCANDVNKKAQCEEPFKNQILMQINRKLHIFGI